MKITNTEDLRAELDKFSPEQEREKKRGRSEQGNSRPYRNAVRHQKHHRHAVATCRCIEGSERSAYPERCGISADNFSQSARNTCC